MDPIDEIDGKKQRRTMLENMQRSSALFQSRMQKAQGKKAEEAGRQHEPPAQHTETADFSSEFTNQDASLSSDGRSESIKSWEDIIEDDEWLTEDEEQEQEGGGGSQERFQEDEEETPSEPGAPEGWKPPPRPGGFFKSSFGGGATPAVTPNSPKGTGPKDPAAEEPVEERLGFSWGPVQPEGQEEGSLPRPPAEPVATVREVPFAATRRGGWSAPPPLASAIAERPRPRPAQMLPPRGQLQQVDQAVAQAARLLVATPSEEPGYEECVRLLSRFGLGALRLCSKAKVKVHILDEQGFIRFPELQEMALEPDELPVDGAYLVKSKTCLIDRRCLTEKPRFFHPALYYFAHALDHAQGGDDFSSRKAAAVLACFEASCTGQNGCDFVDELAATDPVRYFARSVSIYLGRDDCEEPIWTHQDLYDLDRSMYDYLQYLFARFSG